MKRFSDYVARKTTRKGTIRKAAFGRYQICKRDTAARRIFGFAVTGNGNGIENPQGYSVTEKDLELAVYEFMLTLSTATAGQPVSIIESCVFTEEKQQAIGIPPGILPPFAYWIGFEIHDPSIWEMILQSDFPVFTIEITGNTEKG
jgi:hypothetical protein